MKTGHTSCQRGKRVRLKMKNGDVIFGKFLEKQHGWIVLDKGKYWQGDAIGLTIWKKSFDDIRPRV